LVLDDKFRIERLLGMGGMGAVYEITHTITQHRRALKLLHPQYAQRKTLVERFLREASAAGRIGNEHIIETFDGGWLSSGEPYLVMELLDGMPLAERIEERAYLGLSLGETIEIFRQLCDGVQAAHDAGIVHRDLKPENVFLGRGGGHWFVKVLDFGVSKFDEKLATKLTTGGSFVGTPAYMSPEQFEYGADVDSRSDVYSLGVILYEMLAGTHPYPASSLAQLTHMILKSAPRPLSEIRRELPLAIDDLLRDVLAILPEDRIASARTLAERLQAIGPKESANVSMLKTAALDMITQGAGAIPNVSGVRVQRVAALDETELLEGDGGEQVPASEGEKGPAPPSKTLPSAEAEPLVDLPPPARSSRYVLVAVAALLGSAVAYTQLRGEDATETDASAPTESVATVDGPTSASALAPAPEPTQATTSAASASASASAAASAAASTKRVPPPPPLPVPKAPATGRAGMGEFPGQ
jgi:serine/threonine-protein kinase